jgi:effector-binding domain-containing protein
MKKTVFTFILVGAAVFTAFAGGYAYAEEQAGQQVVIKEGKPFYLALMEFGGSYEQIPEKINVFMTEFFKQKLTPGGAMHGIYYNTPQGLKPEDLKWAIGFPVGKDADVRAPLKKVECNHKEIAVYMHIGPYEKMEPSYDKMLKFIESKGYKVVFPAYEKYLNNPAEVKPEELKAEIVIPVEKK